MSRILAGLALAATWAGAGLAQEAPTAQDLAVLAGEFQDKNRAMYMIDTIDQDCSKLVVSRADDRMTSFHYKPGEPPSWSIMFANGALTSQWRWRSRPFGCPEKRFNVRHEIYHVERNDSGAPFLFVSRTRQSICQEPMINQSCQQVSCRKQIPAGSALYLFTPVKEVAEAFLRRMSGGRCP